MADYEYRVFQLRNASCEETEKQLNILARGRWRLVAVVDAGKGAERFYLERQP